MCSKNFPFDVLKNHLSCLFPSSLDLGSARRPVKPSADAPSRRPVPFRHLPPKGLEMRQVDARRQLLALDCAVQDTECYSDLLLVSQTLCWGRGRRGKANAHGGVAGASAFSSRRGSALPTQTSFMFSCMEVGLQSAVLPLG